MHGRICPFCQEKIHPRALVCRHCKRDLPDPGQRPGNCSMGLWAMLAAATVMVAGGAFLAAEFFKERRNWL